MTTHYERRGEVAVLQIDNPPVNGLGHVTRKAMLDGLERALDDAAVKVIVVTYATYDEAELDDYQPVVVHVDEDNRRVSVDNEVAKLLGSSVVGDPRERA